MGIRIFPHSRRYLLIGLMVCLFYNDWIFGFLLNAHLSPTRAMISELSARTQPHHWLFQTMDVGVGTLTLLCVPHVRKFVGRRQGWLGRMLVLCFGLIGLDSIIDATLPLTCAPSADLRCSLASTHSFSTEAHMAESLLIGIITFIAPLVWWHWHRGHHQLLARASWWFAGMQIAVGVGILLAWSANADIVGVCQRVYQLSIGAWMGLVAVLSLAKHRRVSAVYTAKESASDPLAQPVPILAEH